MSHKTGITNSKPNAIPDCINPNSNPDPNFNKGRHEKKKKKCAQNLKKLQPRSRTTTLPIAVSCTGHCATVVDCSGWQSIKFGFIIDCTEFIEFDFRTLAVENA